MGWSSKVNQLPVDGRVFTVQERPAFFIEPVNRPTDRPTPWVWYAPTLPQHPGSQERWMFERFIASGFAIAGIDVGESCGSPDGVALFDALYGELTGQLGLSPRPALLARSRGGLMLYNWAATHPHSVACIAGIYPVCNLASYPGLAQAAGAYGLSTEALAARLTELNPIDRLAPLAAAGVPIFHLHGDCDAIVPLEANSAIVKARYDELGGMMTLDIVADGGHDLQAHWFASQSLVDFITTHLLN